MARSFSRTPPTLRLLEGEEPRPRYRKHSELLTLISRGWTCTYSRLLGRPHHIFRGRAIRCKPTW